MKGDWLKKIGCLHHVLGMARHTSLMLPYRPLPPRIVMLITLSTAGSCTDKLRLTPAYFIFAINRGSAPHGVFVRWDWEGDGGEGVDSGRTGYGVKGKPSGAGGWGMPGKRRGWAAGATGFRKGVGGGAKTCPPWREAPCEHGVHGKQREVWLRLDCRRVGEMAKSGGARQW